MLISIAGFSTRYVALILSQSQDSDARLLIAVLPTVAVTAVVAFKWPQIKKFVEKLHSQSHTDRNSANDADTRIIVDTSAETAVIVRRGSVETAV